MKYVFALAAVLVLAAAFPSAADDLSGQSTLISFSTGRETPPRMSVPLGEQVAKACLYLRCERDDQCDADAGCDDTTFCDCATTECQCR